MNGGWGVEVSKTLFYFTEQFSPDCSAEQKALLAGCKMFKSPKIEGKTLFPVFSREKHEKE